MRGGGIPSTMRGGTLSVAVRCTTSSPIVALYDTCFSQPRSACTHAWVRRVK